MVAQLSFSFPVSSVFASKNLMNLNRKKSKNMNKKEKGAECSVHCFLGFRHAEHVRKEVLWNLHERSPV